MHIDVGGQAVYVYAGGKPHAGAGQAAGGATGSQPVVVFLHGAQQDHSCWLLQSRWFAHHGWRVLAPDLPGHGRSSGDALASIEALADWVAALLAALGIGQASLVGHSMGSLIALEFALRHAPLTLRVALIGASLPMPVAPVLLDAARDDEAKAAAMINAWSYASTSQIGGSAIPGLWLLGVNRRLMERQKPGIFAVDLAACNAYARTPDTLAALRAPVLLLAGRQDRMTPLRAAKDLTAAIPAGRLAVIDGCGHALMAEKPDAVLASLRDFLLA